MKFYRFLSLGLILCTLMANVGITLAETEMLPFKDVTMDNPNFQAIVALKEKGIISGYPDGTFKPNQVVNRAEALKMIYGIDNLNAWSAADGAIFGGATEEVTFKDIDKNAWYFEYLQRAMNDGVVKGYPDNTFKPDQTVNTVENLKMLLEHTFLRVNPGAIDSQEYLLPAYADVSKQEWYSPYVNYARSKNIISADENNKVYPSVGMTRGKLAQAIYNMYKADEQITTNYQMSRNNTTGEFYFMKDAETTLATLPGKITEGADLGDKINKVTNNNAYVSICSTGFGGYIWYDFCYGNTYRIDLKTGEVVNADPREDKTIHLNFMDVSADENRTAWTTDSELRKIYILPPAESDGILEFNVDSKYGQFGDVKFSPDGKNFAYAAIVGNPTEEYSAVYKVNLETGKQTAVVEGLGGPYNVKGWENNETVLYTDSNDNSFPMGL